MIHAWRYSRLRGHLGHFKIWWMFALLVFLWWLGWQQAKIGDPTILVWMGAGLGLSLLLLLVIRRVFAVYDTLISFLGLGIVLFAMWLKANRAAFGPDIYLWLLLVVSFYLHSALLVYGLIDSSDVLILDAGLLQDAAEDASDASTYHAREVFALLQEAQFHLSQAQLRELGESLKHDQPQAALSMLCRCLRENGALVSDDCSRRIHELGIELGLPPTTWRTA